MPPFFSHLGGECRGENGIQKEAFLPLFTFLFLFLLRPGNYKIYAKFAYRSPRIMPKGRPVDRSGREGEEEFPIFAQSTK